MDIDEYSQPSLDEFNEEHPPHLWDLPVSDIDSVSTASVVNKNKYVDTRTTDPGYFCIKERINRRKVRIEGYSSSLIPGVAIRNAVTGYYETDYMGKPTARVGTSDEDRFFKVVIAINGIGKNTRALFYDSISQHERHFKTKVSQSNTDKWNRKMEMVNKREQERKSNAAQEYYA